MNKNSAIIILLCLFFTNQVTAQINGIRLFNEDKNNKDKDNVRELFDAYYWD